MRTDDGYMLELELVRHYYEVMGKIEYWEAHRWGVCWGLCNKEDIFEKLVWKLLRVALIR